MKPEELAIQVLIDEALAKRWKPITFDEETNDPSYHIPIQMTFLGLQIPDTCQKILRDFPVVELKEELVDGELKDVEYPIANPTIIEIMASMKTGGTTGNQLRDKFQLTEDDGKSSMPWYVKLNAIISDVDEGGEDDTKWYSTAQEFRDLKKLTNPTSRIGGQLFTLGHFQKKVIKYES